MKKLALLMIVVLSLSFLGCGGSSTEKEVVKQKVKKVEMSKDFTLAPGWSGNYKEQNFVIKFNDKEMTGVISFDGIEGETTFRWEEERPSSNRINIELSENSKARFDFKSKNSRQNISLKLEFVEKGKLKMYNGVFLKDGKLAKDDGRVELNRIIK